MVMAALLMSLPGVLALALVPFAFVAMAVYADAEGGALPVEEESYPEDRQDPVHGGEYTHLAGGPRNRALATPPRAYPPGRLLARVAVAAWLVSACATGTSLDPAAAAWASGASRSREAA
jgi:hypothetical protein